MNENDVTRPGCCTVVNWGKKIFIIANILKLGESITGSNSKFLREHLPWKPFLNVPSSVTPLAFSHKVVPWYQFSKKKKKKKKKKKGSHGQWTFFAVWSHGLKWINKNSKWSLVFYFRRHIIGETTSSLAEIFIFTNNSAFKRLWCYRNRQQNRWSL